MRVAIINHVHTTDLIGTHYLIYACTFKPQSVNEENKKIKVEDSNFLKITINLTLTGKY